MQKTAVVVVGSLVLMALASLATATHPDDVGDERDATYLGSSHVEHLLNEDCAEALGEPECPARIVRGSINTICDYSNSQNIWTAGMYQGRGGSSFCQVQKSIDNESVSHVQFVRIKFEDISLFDPLGKITCPTTSTDPSGDVVSWHEGFAELEGNDVWVTAEVPSWCDSVGTHEHRTNVVIFNRSADLREGVKVGGALEGTAHLEVLSPLPGV